MKLLTSLFAGFALALASPIALASECGGGDKECPGKKGSKENAITLAEKDCGKKKDCDDSKKKDCGDKKKDCNKEA